MIGAIILAAGAGRRMGRAKALLPYRGRTFLEHVAATSYDVGADPRIVVLGPDADKIVGSIDLSSVVVVRNPHPSSGPLHSLKLGLRALNQTVEGVLVWHVDRPQVLPRTIEALLERARSGSHPIVVPRFDRRRGHPVVFMRGVFRELLATPDKLGARAVVRAERDRVLAVDVSDPGVLVSIDTQGDYAALLANDDEC